MEKKNIWMNHRVKFVLLIIVSYCYFTSHRDNRRCNLLAGKRPHRKVEESSCNAWWRERSNKNCAILLYYYFSSFFFFYHIIVQQLYTTFQDVVKKNRDKKKKHGWNSLEWHSIRMSGAKAINLTDFFFFFFIPRRCIRINVNLLRLWLTEINFQWNFEELKATES